MIRFAYLYKLMPKNQVSRCAEKEMKEELSKVTRGYICEPSWSTRWGCVCVYFEVGERSILSDWEHTPIIPMGNSRTYVEIDQLIC